jgi:Response regulators consisting of a CheY-like receiver domain and a winged-helix DNA-binding domain
MEKKKVLITDDETEILTILKKKLSESGYEASIAFTAEDCLELAKRELPDIILLDIILPDMNGYEVAQKLRDDPETENIKILFTTGQDLEPRAIMDRCKELGAFDYLEKPFTLEELLKKIEEVLNR